MAQTHDSQQDRIQSFSRDKARMAVQRTMYSPEKVRAIMEKSIQLPDVCVYAGPRPAGVSKSGEAGNEADAKLSGDR